MEQSAPVIRSIDNSKPAAVHETMKGFSAPITILIFVLAIALGTGIGYVTAGPSAGGAGGSSPLKAVGLASAPKTAGTKDEKKFPDTAEGTLKKGGIEGEGNFHIERKGGESQNVYVTSSIVDLSLYVGKKVKVMGQTFEGEKAGWLMDVGYIEIL